MFAWYLEHCKNNNQLGKFSSAVNMCYCLYCACHWITNLPCVVNRITEIQCLLVSDFEPRRNKSEFCLVPSKYFSFSELCSILAVNPNKYSYDKTSFFFSSIFLWRKSHFNGDDTRKLTKVTEILIWKCSKLSLGSKWMKRSKSVIVSVACINVCVRKLEYFNFSASASECTWIGFKVVYAGYC